MTNSPEVHLSPIARAFFLTVGTIALILGAIGIFLPVLPTTPFVLVAATCYAKSSQRFYNALMNHRLFGPYLKAWRHEHRIPLHAKILATVMIVVSISCSIIFFIPITAVKILVAISGVAVLIYIHHFPS